MAPKRTILWHLWKNPGVARKEIALNLGLHPNVVSDAIRELIQEGWVVEGKPKPVNAGRAPISLHLNLERRAALCVNYNLQGMICALVDADGNVMKQVELDYTPGEPEQLVELVAQTLNQVKAGYPGEVIGVGVADPGMVDSVKGEVVCSSYFPEWHHVPIAALLKERMGLTVFLEDTTRARSLGQCLITPALRQREASILYLDYGYGVGCALVTGEGIWLGTGFAGELGHVVVEPGGSLCRCGARGCLESLAGSYALETRAKDLLAQGVNSILQGRQDIKAEAIFKAALDGDRMARNVVEEVVSHLRLAVAFLVASLHPGFLVVGGESEAAIQCLAGELSAAVQDLTLPEIASSVEVIEGSASRHLALTGAAVMVFEKTMRRA